MEVASRHQERSRKRGNDLRLGNANRKMIGQNTCNRIGSLPQQGGEGAKNGVS